MPKYQRLHSDCQDSSMDIIENRALQLNSLLQCISGGGFNSFDGLREDYKSNVLWAYRDLAEDMVWHFRNEDVHLEEGKK